MSKVYSFNNKLMTYDNKLWSYSASSPTPTGTYSNYIIFDKPDLTNLSVNYRSK